MNFEIKLKEPKIFVSIAEVRGVEVAKKDSESMKLLREVLEKLKEKYSVEKLKDDPVVRAFRDFYWRIGIDPTKQRPSSEALLRRGLKGEIPLINNVVDAGNIASMETLIPIGLYDIAKIKGNLELRYAKKGEVFCPIGGKDEALEENQIVLADEEKILHVYPYRDSRLTMVSNTTKDVLIVACGVPGVEAERVKLACEKAMEYIVVLAGGIKKFVGLVECSPKTQR
ncbi:MAG: phenylalanine--tRNA ligase beta subunit-related protein [Archaeoglobaceae archaeon]